MALAPDSSGCTDLSCATAHPDAHNGERPVSGDPALIIPSITKFTQTTDLDHTNGHVGTRTLWMCGAMVDYGSGPVDPVVDFSGCKSETLASVLGMSVRAAREQVSGSIYVLPHEVVHHRLSKTCDCPVCQLVASGALGEDVHLVAGDPAEDVSGYAHVHEQVRRWAVLLRETRTHRRVGGIDIEVISRVAESHRTGVGVPDTETVPASPDIGLPHGVRERVDIYTDASLSTAASVPARAGVAAVDERGWFALGVVDTRKCGTDRTTYAEMVGVENALTYWIGRARKIVVHTDSRSAQRLIRRVLNDGHCGTSGRGSFTARNVARMIGDYEKIGGSVEVRWVPGHSGVPGNELADELCLHVRRSLVGRGTRGAVTPVPLESIISLVAAKVSEVTGRTPVMAPGSLDLPPGETGRVNSALAHGRPVRLSSQPGPDTAGSLIGAVA